MELKKKLEKQLLSPLGMVPTMGALHEGHISLVAEALSKCPLVVISIFVNPTQFNDREDLKNYPRTPVEDIALLDKYLRNDDIVFTPGNDEIYPSRDNRVFRFGNLENVMEALHRPGHFNGVAQVVSRLFEIVEPDIAFFGLKDLQQVAVIKEMVRQLKLKVTIQGCPIIRESDGLAMSSRNRLLDKGIRERAAVIYQTILKATEMIRVKEIHEIKDSVRSNIEKEEGFRVEYFEIVDDTNLIPINTMKEMKKGKRYFGCVAVKAGKVRLIDNIEFPLV